MRVFIKKDNNNQKKYYDISRRFLAIINDEYSRQVEEYYTKYIEENSRKGTR